MILILLGQQFFKLSRCVYSDFLTELRSPICNLFWYVFKWNSVIFFPEIGYLCCLFDISSFVSTHMIYSFILDRGNESFQVYFFLLLHHINNCLETRHWLKLSIAIKLVPSVQIDIILLPKTPWWSLSFENETKKLRKKTCLFFYVHPNLFRDSFVSPDNGYRKI